MLLSRSLVLALLGAALIAGAAPGDAQTALQPAPSATVISSVDLAKKGTVELTGAWTIQGDLSLGGDTHLTFKQAHVSLSGNLVLSDNAVLSIEGNSIFNLAQTQSFQYAMQAKGHSTLQILDSEFQTNGGAADVLFPTSFVGTDDATLIVKNAHSDMKRNWVLGGFKDRSRLISSNTVHLPIEIYPEDAANLRIEDGTVALVWIKLVKDQFALFDDIPARNTPSIWSFGKSRPDKTNAKFQLDWKNANVEVNVQSAPGSDIRIVESKSPVGIGYFVDGNTEPETIAGLVGGPERRSLALTAGRKLTIVNSIITGWQFYADNSHQPVTLKDSTINEAIAGDGGDIHASNCKFLYGGLGVFGKHGRFEIDDSDIRVFSLLSNNDGLVTVRNSTIHGSTIQASETGKIVLLNDEITANNNPYFGGEGAPAHFVVQDQGEIIGLAITPIKPISRNQPISFTGDAFVETKNNAVIGTYTLSYQRPGRKPVTVVKNAPMPVHAARLGVVRAGILKPGKYKPCSKLPFQTEQTPK